MTESLQLLTEYGYAIILIWVVLDQAGLPLPAEPALFGAGILAGTGSLDIVVVVSVALIAAVTTNLIWFAIGRRHGHRVLQYLCRISLEPDFCVRKSATTIERNSVKTLLLANFIPGLQTLAPPLSGLAGLQTWVFIILRAIGTGAWLALFILPGYILADRAIEFLGQSAQFASTMAVVAVGAMIAFIGYKYLRRQWFVRAVKVGGVRASDLHSELRGLTPPKVADLRCKKDIEAFPHIIPGARVIPLDEIDQHTIVLSQIRDLVVYCNCPDDASSVHVALMLRRRGAKRVRLLMGGLTQWVSLGLPLSPWLGADSTRRNNQ